MELTNAPLHALRRNIAHADTENKDPAAWFRADPDVWAPPVTRDPDIFGPPVDR